MSHFRLPAEWAPREATWCAWPKGEDEWDDLAAVHREFSALVRELAARETVHMLVDGEPPDLPCTFHRLGLDDVWFRDNGPLFVTSGDEVALVDFDFNAWGGKYPFLQDRLAAQRVADFYGVRPAKVPMILEGGSLEVNGEGLGITTRQCLLEPGRQPPVTEAALRDYLGVDRLIWLDQGLEGDHTDGHIDTLTRFVSPSRVVTCVADPSDSNYAALEANRRVLEAEGLEVVALPIPREKRYYNGVRKAESYANFYIATGCVLVPIYGDDCDELALNVLRREFPGRQVLGLRARHISTGGGGFHCLTQPQPKGKLCDWR